MLFQREEAGVGLHQIVPPLGLLRLHPEGEEDPLVEDHRLALAGPVHIDDGVGGAEVDGNRGLRRAGGQLLEPHQGHADGGLVTVVVMPGEEHRLDAAGQLVQLADIALGFREPQAVEQQAAAGADLRIAAGEPVGFDGEALRVGPDPHPGGAIGLGAGGVENLGDDEVGGDPEAGLQFVFRIVLEVQEVPLPARVREIRPDGQILGPLLDVLAAGQTPLDGMHGPRAPAHGNAQAHQALAGAVDQFGGLGERRRVHDQQGQGAEGQEGAAEARSMGRNVGGVVEADQLLGEEVLGADHQPPFRLGLRDDLGVGGRVGRLGQAVAAPDGDGLGRLAQGRRQGGIDQDHALFEQVLHRQVVDRRPQGQGAVGGSADHGGVQDPGPVQHPEQVRRPVQADAGRAQGRAVGNLFGAVVLELAEQGDQGRVEVVVQLRGHGPQAFDQALAIFGEDLHVPV